MAISYISQAAAEATTVTPGTHAAGDILVAFAFRDGSTTAPSLPAGWTSIGVNSGTLCASIVGIKVAASSAETSGTWTNATGLIIQVYRGQKVSSPLVNSGGQTGTATTVNYAGITTMTDPGNSWVLRFAGHSSIDTALNTAPAGHTNRSNTTTNTTNEVAGFDTNGTAASSTFAGVAVGGTSGNFITKTLELLVEPAASTAHNLLLLGVGS